MLSPSPVPGELHGSQVSGHNATSTVKCSLSLLTHNPPPHTYFMVLSLLVGPSSSLDPELREDGDCQTPTPTSRTKMQRLRSDYRACTQAGGLNRTLARCWRLAFLKHSCPQPPNPGVSGHH